MTVQLRRMSADDLPALWRIFSEIIQDGAGCPHDESTTEPDFVSYSLLRAPDLGASAVQFNLVVSTNERAVALWRGLGFRVLGTLPRAFEHRTLGRVDAFVMYRETGR